MEKPKNADRRNLFVTGARASAAVLAATTIPVLATRLWADEATAKRSYFPFHTKGATVIDFGLSKAQEERALALHKSLLVFDGEFEVTWHDNIIDNVLAGGGSGGSFTVGVAGLAKFKGRKTDLLVKREDWWAEHTLFQDIGFLLQLEREQPDRIKLCYKAEDFREAKRDGKVGLMMDVQNTISIGNDTSKLETYYGLGIRRVQLTYNFNVPAGTGCMEAFGGGLSIFGHEVVAKLNELNMIVDTGHSSSQTVIEAVKASSKPVCCSHAGLKSISPTNPRTQSDEALKAVAESGGVFGVVSTPGALVGGAECSVNDYLDSIEVAVNIMGIEHVGFALDHNSAASLPEWFTSPSWNPEAAAKVGVSIWPWSDGHKGMENQSGYLNLTRGLVARGYKDQDIAKLMGENFMRLTQEVVG